MPKQTQRFDDVVSIIEAVRSRSYLWDRNSKDYRGKNENKGVVWTKVAEDANWLGGTVMSHVSHLRRPRRRKAGRSRRYGGVEPCP